MQRARDQRIPELDGWRVLLIFVVCWFHTWQQSWLTPRIGSLSLDFLVRAGYMTVDGTILLSGFLLYLPWARCLRAGGVLPETRDFYRRRAARILPSFYVFILLELAFVIVPQGLYASAGFMAEDLAAHFTFVFNWFRRTYLSSPIFGGSWTLAVEMQFYLMFPLLARPSVKRPAAVLLGMLAAAGYWRGWCLWHFGEYSMVVNQLPSFLDVYALGMALAVAYVRLDERRRENGQTLWQQLAATAVFLLALWGCVLVLQAQARENGYPAIQGGQMIRRPVWALLLGAAMLSLPFTVLPVRWLFGNRAMGFLAGISMNCYLVHQVVSVQLKHWNIPYSEFENPNMAGDPVWQGQYTALCVGIALAIAIALTYLVEKPCARLMLKARQKGPAAPATGEG